MTGALRGTDPLEAALLARGQAGPGHLGPEVALLRTAEAGTGSRGRPEATTVMPRLYTTSEHYKSVALSTVQVFNCVMHHIRLLLCYIHYTCVQSKINYTSI